MTDKINNDKEKNENSSFKEIAEMFGVSDKFESDSSSKPPINLTAEFTKVANTCDKEREQAFQELLTTYKLSQQNGTYEGYELIEPKISTMDLIEITTKFEEAIQEEA